MTDVVEGSLAHENELKDEEVDPVKEVLEDAGMEPELETKVEVQDGEEEEKANTKEEEKTKDEDKVGEGKDGSKKEENGEQAKTEENNGGTGAQTPRKRNRKKKKKRQAPREGEAPGAAAKDQQQQNGDAKSENGDRGKNEDGEKNENDKDENEEKTTGEEKTEKKRTKKAKKAKKTTTNEKVEEASKEAADGADKPKEEAKAGENVDEVKPEKLKKKKKKKAKSPRGGAKNSALIALAATAPAALKLNEAKELQGIERKSSDPPLSAVRAGPRASLMVSSPATEAPASPSGVRFAQRLSLANVIPKLSTLPIDKKPRTFNSNIYNYSFSGKTLVKWMLDAGMGVRFEPEAMILGELMLNAGVIVPLSRKVEFSSSGKDYYALTDGYIDYTRPPGGSTITGSMIGGRVMSSDDTRKLTKRSSVMLTFRSISMRGLNQLSKSKQEKDKKEDDDQQTYIYGRSLEEVMVLQMHSHPDEKVPIILKTLTKAIIDTQGHKTEGIFRVPGKNDEINRLKNQFNKMDYTITSDDPNDLGGALKLWVRELKEPLLPNNIYDDCVLVANDPAACLEIVSTRVPELNRNVIYYLLSFLQEMARHANITRMGSANLGMVFAPGLLRCDDVMKMMTNTAHEGAFVKNLIEHYKPAESV